MHLSIDQIDQRPSLLGASCESGSRELLRMRVWKVAYSFEFEFEPMLPVQSIVHSPRILSAEHSYSCFIIRLDCLLLLRGEAGPGARCSGQARQSVRSKTLVF